MLKTSMRLLTVTMVTLLFTVSVSADANPPADAQNLWRYYPFLVDSREAGCNAFLTTFENGIWTGIFDGTSTEDGKVVIHCSGSASFNAIVSFDEVTVDGKSGTLEMSVVGKFPAGATEWYGHWVILSGSGDLENLRGQGTWWGPGAPDFEEWGDIYYSGKIHFSPDKD